MKPRVSVIVPVYNVEKYIHRCIKTIQNQSLEDIEIILVDDGSKDNCKKICDEYANSDNRIKVIHKENAGLGFARNTGIENATSKYIVFIDSDDYIELNMLEELYNNIEKNNVDVCYCDFNRVKNGNIISAPHLIGKQGVYEKEQIKNIIIPDLIGGSPDNKNDDVIGWGVWKAIYKRNIITKNQVYFHSEKEMISEDIIFQLDYLKYVNKVSILEKRLYNYCINNNSLSTTYRADRFDKILYLYESKIKRLIELDSFEQSKIRADRLLLANIRMEFMIDIKALKYKECKKILKGILYNKTVINISKTYPINKLPLRQKIYGYLIRYKQIELIYIITLLYIRLKYK